jgi:hypothetical protein
LWQEAAEVSPAVDLAGRSDRERLGLSSPEMLTKMVHALLFIREPRA